jgi:hypothetical protein
LGVLASLTRRQLLGVAAGIMPAIDALPLSASSLTIHPRESWATDRPPRGPLDAEDARFLIVHHSASNNGHTGADAPRIIRGFYDYHTSAAKGWNDVAYNFLIDADGGIWEGRAGSLAGPVAGDATGGNQGFTQLVCVIGDYDAASPTAASMASLVALLAMLADRYEISTAPGAEVSFTSRGSNRHPKGSPVTTPTITGHRTMSQTSCPGDNLDAYVVGALRADVEATRLPPPSSTTTTSSPSTTTTLPRTTTTERPTSTTISTTTSTRAPSDSLPVAAESPVNVWGVPPGVAAATAAFLLTGAGLLLWRQRRMKG